MRDYLLPSWNVFFLLDLPLEDERLEELLELSLLELEDDELLLLEESELERYLSLSDDSELIS